MSRVIAAGSLRVDARRAVAKLREHLLVDLHLYALEIVRAAVAGGATFVDVAHGADGVAFTFDGEPPKVASLARLLDHVLDETGAPGERPRRLLALGVNAALGLGPAHVEVLVASKPCARVRWTPALLEAGELPSLETVPVPAYLPAGGVRVQVRRRLGWNVLRAAALGGLPRELELLAGATADIPIPLTLAGGPFPRPPRPEALLRVRFDVPGARRAALEIVAGPAAPTLDFLELGVVLIRAPLDFGAALPRDPEMAAELPVRVMVDVDVLPTNASRSALLEDARLPRLAAEAALGALADAARALAVAAGIEEAEAPPGVDVLSGDPVAWEDALGLLAWAVARALTAGAEVPAELRRVVDLPLFRNAVGRPVSWSDLRRDATGALRVLRMPEGEGPLPAELAPWMDHVVWLRGRAAERMLEGLRTADAAPLIGEARVGLERRRRLLLRARGEPVLPAELDASGRDTLRVAFEVREGPFEGLRGEVALPLGGAVTMGGEPPRARARVHAHVDGRLLETVELDANLLPLPIEAAFAWEGRVVARFSYDGVERDQAFRRAVHYAAVVAMFALDREVARASKARDAEAEARLRPTVRAAIGTLLVGEERLGVEGVRQAPELRALKAIHAARVWATTEPGRFESVMSLGAFVLRHHALVIARPGTAGRAADGRPVLTLDTSELRWLSPAFGNPVVVPYGAGLLRPGEEAAREALRAEVLRRALGGSALGPVLAFERPGHRGLVAVAAEPRVTICHASRVLAASPTPSDLGPVVVVLDDDGLVPSPGWDAVHAGMEPGRLAAIEHEHCERLCAAIEGDPEARARFGWREGIEALPAVRDYLVDRASHLRRNACAAADPEVALQLLARLEGLPLLTVLDARGAPARASLGAILGAHPPPSPLPVLREPPGFETLDWCPLLVPDDAELATVNRWFGGRAIRAEAALSNRLLLAGKDRERRAFLSGPEQDPRALGDLAAPSAPTFFLDGASQGGISVAAAIPRASLGVSHAWVDVLFRGRALCRRPLPSLPLPVVARVGLTDEVHVREWRDLSVDGVTSVVERVYAAAVGLALEVARRASGPGRGGALFGDLGALRLFAALLALDQAHPRMMLGVWLGDTVDAGVLIGGLPAALRSGALPWATVQGEEQPFDALRTGGGAVYFGHARHVPWRAAEHPAELDAPILHVPLGPEGEALRELVELLGWRTRDVTAALAALQQRRAANEPAEVPRLAGAPLHPDLRVGLGALGARYAEGEIEIAEGPASDITIIDLSGTPRQLPAELPFPVRAVLRVDSVDTGKAGDRALLQKLARSAGKLLLSLAPRAEELPEVVRAHLRRVVVKALEKQKKPGKRLEEARIFGDVSGAFRSYAELAARTAGTWECTLDPPPYPSGPARAGVLRLDPAEMRALAISIPLKNLTSIMRRDLEGERRASGPQVAEVALGADLRSMCLSVVTVNEGGVTGEVGLLAPEHQDARGLSIFVMRRPLCSLKDGTGWPIVAALDDAAAPVNRSFDGLRTTAAGFALQRVARAAARRALETLISPPPDAIGVHWLAGGERGLEGITVAGALWLPAEWPREPWVRVRVPGSGGLAVRRSLVAAEAPAHLLGDVPLAGDLLATADGPWTSLATLALHAALSMLSRAGDLPAASRAAYRWDLRLLGFHEGDELRAAAAGGETVTAEQVLAELEARAEVWVTERRGDTEGDFPTGAPSFVLLAHPEDGETSPLVEVLQRRAAPGVLRTLGGAAPDAAFLGRAPEASIVPVDGPPTVEDAPVEPAPEASWLTDLWGAVRSFFSREDPLPATPLSTAVEEALHALALRGEPVAEVRETRSGRPVRYDPRSRRILLNPRHRALAWLGPGRAADERAVVLLAAAAVCECNRLLAEVTDDDEREALGALLERAARGRGPAG